MNGGFSYQDGVLHAENLSLSVLADAVGTPAYVYSSVRLEANYRRFSDAFSGLDARICFAVKANSNQAVIRTFAELGAGADVVSLGEMKRALAAGAPADKIVYSGVGKTRGELRAALEAGLWQINLESLPEMVALSEIAAEMNVVASVAVRVNPDVDAGSHHKISTGRKENKFGIDIDHARQTYADIAQRSSLKAVGVAVHIGSQLTGLEPFRPAFQRVADLVRALRDDGHDIRRIDFGGGLGVVYHNENPPSPAEYAEVIRHAVGDLGCVITVEPGRALVGDAGILLSRVVYRKSGLHRRFLILDAAMNDLIRPALYDAWHTITPVVEASHAEGKVVVDVVGPVCETGDTFATQRALPPLSAGDLVAIMTAGAYGAAMASSYNSRPLLAEVLVRNREFAVIRPRQTIEDLIGLDRLPSWLS
ncbi:Diaminopimelate decarboxylase [Azospirillaceae bacterium]